MVNVVFLTAESASVEKFGNYCLALDEIEQTRIVNTTRLLKDITSIAKLHIDLLVIDCDHLVAPLEVLVAEIKKERFCDYPVALISDVDASKILTLVRLDFAGVINKQEGIDGFRAAIEVITSANFFVSQSFNQKIYSSMLSTTAVKADLNSYQLSAKQQQLIKMLVEGYTYAAISSKIGITVGSVKQAVTRLYKKLGICNRNELVALYYQDRLISHN